MPIKKPPRRKGSGASLFHPFACGIGSLAVIVWRDMGSGRFRLVDEARSPGQARIGVLTPPRGLLRCDALGVWFRPLRSVGQFWGLSQHLSPASPMSVQFSRILPRRTREDLLIADLPPWQLRNSMSAVEPHFPFVSIYSPKHTKQIICNTLPDCSQTKVGSYAGTLEIYGDWSILPEHSPVAQR